VNYQSDNAKQSAWSGREVHGQGGKCMVAITRQLHVKYGPNKKEIGMQSVKKRGDPLKGGRSEKLKL